MARWLVWLLPTLVGLAGCSGGKPGGAGALESGAESGGPTDTGPFLEDADEDGYLSDEDCDDTNAAVNPGAEEICDGLDNDCSGYTDEDDPYLDRDTMSSYYFDLDGDGYGNSDSIVISCSQPEGYGPHEGDCDETNAAINPGAVEICDEIDNDCNEIVDDSATEGDWYYTDEDGDGIGVPGELVLACSGASIAGDCNDEDPTEPQVVDADSSGLVAGTLAFPWLNIQDGIDNADECVLVFAGTYAESLDFGGKNVAVVGAEGAESTIIDATGLGGPAVTFANGESSEASLAGFTITGGQGEVSSSTYSYSCGSRTTCNEYTTSYCGGAIYVNGASPTLSDLILTANTLSAASTSTSGYDTWYVSSFGGALCLLGGSVSLSDSVISSNFADVGGGIYLDEDSQLDLARSELVANTATDGAAVAVDGGSITLSHTLSTWNEATGEGGGVWLENGTLSASQITWGEEDAPTGGVLSASGTASLSVTNAILYGSDTGACVAFADGASLYATYNNLYGCAGGAVTGGTDPTGSNGNIAADPLFVSVSADGDPTNDDWTLSAGSPSIDAGDPSLLDEDGSVSDQGAYGGT